MEFLSTLRIQDLIDITILTLLLYQIILMMQGTRNVQIVIGIALAAVAYKLADFFGLVGLSWLLDNLFSSIILIIVVLFQADFRNAFAQMGTRSYFRRTVLDAAKDKLDKLYDVCEHLSKTRTGALVVLEKTMGLREFYKGATELDAKFSDRLLVAIFNPKAPLHDGAVLMNREFKVTHAGCILPLSTEINLSKSLGTRHRAALGLSEESDSLILVVSEETGQISLAFQGVLYRPSDGVDIKEKLYELYAKTEKQLLKEKEEAQAELTSSPDLETSEEAQ